MNSVSNETKDTGGKFCNVAIKYYKNKIMLLFSSQKIFFPLIFLRKDNFMIDVGTYELTCHNLFFKSSLIFCYRYRHQLDNRFLKVGCDW